MKTRIALDMWHIEGVVPQILAEEYEHLHEYFRILACLLVMGFLVGSAWERRQDLPEHWDESVATQGGNNQRIALSIYKTGCC